MSFEDDEKPEGIPVALAEGDRITLDLQEAPRGKLSGLVRQAGSPVAGVSVQARAGDAPPLPDFFGIGMGAQSAEDGRYELSELKVGAYQIVASKPGAAMPVQIPIEIRQGENVLHIDIPGGTIEGRVVDAVTGKPIEGVRVKAESMTGSSKQVGVAVSLFVSSGSEGSVVTHEGGAGEPSLTDKEGKFLLADLPPKKYRLKASGSKAYAEGESEEVELGLDEKKKGIEIRLHPGGSIAGRVLGSAGNSVGLAFLHLSKVSGERVKIAATGMDGAFRLEGLPAGSYRLRAQANQVLEESEIEFTIEAGKTIEREIRLTPSD